MIDKRLRKYVIKPLMISTSIKICFRLIVTSKIIKILLTALYVDDNIL